MSSRSERGSVTLWVLGLCLMMLFIGGIAIDLWRAFSERTALANTADAAAVAGSNAIDADYFRATNEVRLDPALAEEQARQSLDSQADRRSFLTATTQATPERVTVTATGSVNFTLLRVFMDDAAPFTVTVRATAAPRRSP